MKTKGKLEIYTENKTLIPFFPVVIIIINQLFACASSKRRKTQPIWSMNHAKTLPHAPIIHLTSTLNLCHIIIPYLPKTKL